MFGDMNLKQRAEALEKLKGCIRCTSWTHLKSDCKLNVIDCKEIINGSQCHRDHSKLVCNSGVAYCLAAHTTLDGVGHSDINVLEDTLHYVQDIPINNGGLARVFWDNGSNRVLIHNEFAREKRLKSRDAQVTLKVVDEGFKTIETKIYELDLCDMYCISHPIWGYGVDNILDYDDPVNLQYAKSLFPHVPEQAFVALPKRRIDILVGINYNALHPSGGLGVDSVGNLKALRSRFGCGWVIGGCQSNVIQQ